MSHRTVKVAALAAFFVGYFAVLATCLYMESRSVDDEIARVRSERAEVERAIRLIRDQRSEIETLRKSLKDIGR